MVLNLIALIPFSTFLFLFLKSRKKENHPGSILIGLYLIGAMFAVFLDLDIALPAHNKYKHDFAYFLLYSLILSLFLIPAYKIKKVQSINELRFFKKNSAILNLLSLFSWFSFLYLTPFALKSLVMSSLEVRLGLGSGDISVLPKNIFTTIATGIATFYPMFIFLFYVSYVQKRSFFITLSMFIGGFSYVISTFAFAGRDGIVFFTIILIIFYKFFEKVIDKKRILKYKKQFYLLSILSFLLLLKISADRFDRNQGVYSTVHIGILGYGGMQAFIFNDFLDHFDNFNYGNNSYYVLKEFLGLKVGNTTEAIEPMEWQFGTFLTSFYKINGLASMSLISLLFFTIFYGLIPKINSAKLPFRMIILGFYFQFMVTGFFYFRLGNPAGRKYMIILVLLFIFLIIRYKGISKFKRL